MGQPLITLDSCVAKRGVFVAAEGENGVVHLRHGAAILFVTHDLGVVAKICRTMTMLHAGRVLKEGDTVDVLAKPRRPYTRALLAATPRRPAGRGAAPGRLR